MKLIFLYLLLAFLSFVNVSNGIISNQFVSKTISGKYNFERRQLDESINNTLILVGIWNYKIDGSISFDLIFYENAKSDFPYYNNVNFSITLYYKKEDKIDTVNEQIKCGKLAFQEDLEPGELFYECNNYNYDKNYTDLYRVELTDYHFTFSDDQIIIKPTKSINEYLN